MALGDLFKKSGKSDPNKLYGKDGQPLPGYLNASAGAERPALIINHDWFGLTPQHRELADRFAAEGFVTFAPDLYHGKYATDVATAEKLNQALMWPRVDQDIQNIVEALRARNPSVRIGATGFGMGGATAVHGALGRPQISAVVTFYGIPKQGDYRRLASKLQAHFGRRDPRCNPDRVSQFEAALTEVKARFEIHRYEGAGNGFFHKQGPEYSAKDAPVAYSRTIQFLHSVLG